jgi:hypothetical protein
MKFRRYVQPPLCAEPSHGCAELLASGVGSAEDEMETARTEQWQDVRGSVGTSRRQLM